MVHNIERENSKTECSKVYIEDDTEGGGEEGEEEGI